jgi:hypothetical protein
MAKHHYSGYVSLGFQVSDDKPLDYNELVQKVADYISDCGIAGCDLGDVDYWEENEDV